MLIKQYLALCTRTLEDCFSAFSGKLHKHRALHIRIVFTVVFSLKKNPKILVLAFDVVTVAALVTFCLQKRCHD